MSNSKSIAQSLNESSSKNLSRMGYTIDYGDALSSLYNPLLKNDLNFSNSSSNSLNDTSTSDYYSSLLRSDSLSGEVLNGFIRDEKLQQAVCVLKPWQSFPILSKDKNGNEEEYNVSVGNPPGKIGILSGNSLCGASTIIPDVISKSEKSMFESDDDFIIGVGVDLDKFGGSYFKHFYGNCGWSNLDEVISKLKILAENKLLFAEITLDIDGGKILNAPIIISPDDLSSSGTGGTPFRLWIPCPLLLLNHFSSLGSIHITNQSGKIIACGSEDAIFQYADSDYEHKKGVIKGLKKNSYERILNKSGKSLNLQFQGVTWKIGGSEFDKKVRVRLYFDDEKRVDVENIIGLVPKSAERVFGPLEKIVTTKLIDTSSAYNYDGNAEIYYKEGVYPEIDKETYIAAIRLIWCYEVRSAQGKPGFIHVLHGETWPSYGSFQVIQRHDNNGIIETLKEYEKICLESGSPYDVASLNNAFCIKQSSRAGSKEFEALKSLGDNDSRMMYAQTKHFWDKRMKSIMSLYKSLNFNSAFGFYYCADCVNNGYKKKIFKNNAYIKYAQTEEERVRNAIEVRISYLKSIKNGLLWRSIYGGWRNKMREWQENTANGNYDLKIPKKWNGILYPRS